MSTHRRTVGLCAAIALGAITGTMLSALGPAAVTAGAQRVAAAVVTEKQYGFSFSLAPRWKQIPLDSNDIGALVSADTKADPSFGPELAKQVVQAAKKGIKVFAVGPFSGAVYPVLQIGVLSAAGQPTGSAFIDLTTAQLKVVLAQAGAIDLTVVPVRNQLGQVVQARCEFQLNPSSPRTSELQFYLEHGTRVYAIGFGASTFAQDQSVAEVLERSWHWYR